MKLSVNQTGFKLAESILNGSANVAQLEMRLTVADNLNKPLIKSAFKGKEEICFRMVQTLVKRFTDSFGFSTKKTPTEIELLTVDTLDKFQYESIEDIILFFKMARSGSFGTTGRGIDSNLIFGDWFPKYMELKSQKREEGYEKKKSDENVNRRGSTKEEVFDRYKQDSGKVFDKKVSEYVDRITLSMDRQLLEDTIRDWEGDEEKSPYVALLKKKRRTIN